MSLLAKFHCWSLLSAWLKGARTVSSGKWPVSSLEFYMIDRTPSTHVSEPADVPGPVLVTGSLAKAASPPSVFRSILRGLPTVLIVCLLGGLAWSGHLNGWKLPRPAVLFGQSQQTNDDWCDAHAVPESQCVECNPSLFARPKLYAFCDVHGVHQCPFEHPDMAQVAKLPNITQADLDRALRALKFKAWPENNPTCNKLHRLLQFASEAVLNKMGVGVMPVIEKAMVETVSATGEFTFEQPRVTPISTVVSGRIWRVTPLGTLGTQVKKGDVLALLDALEVGKAKAELLQAFTQLSLRQGDFYAAQRIANSGRRFGC